MKYTLAAWLFAFTAAGAGAAPSAIYRCGPEGREYSQVPCAGGTLVDASDPRSAAQRAEAVKVAARERQRAAELERERRAQEAATKPAIASGFNGRPPPPQVAGTSASERAYRGKRHTKVKPLPGDASTQDAAAARRRRN